MALRHSVRSGISAVSSLSRLTGENGCLDQLYLRIQELRGKASAEETENANEEDPKKEHLKRALDQIQKDSMRYKNSSARPWLDRNGRVIWPSSRIFVAKIVRSQSFETFMGIVIMLNILLMICETDFDASCYPTHANNLQSCPTHSRDVLWIQVCNIVLQVVYTMECLMRAFVEREKYVWNRWNQLDLLCTVPGWVTLGLSTQVNFAVFRTLRVVRLLRAGRLLISIPEIYILMSGLASALKPIFFGSVMLLSVIVLWAIIAVEFLHPTNAGIPYSQCDRCPKGFASVYTASLTLFSQLVAQDNWSELSLPLAEEAPWTTPLMFIILMTVSLGVMNLILAVVVEKAAEARENDQERKMKLKENERERNKIELAVLCDRMDNDGSGALSLKEMLDGFDMDLNFKSLMAYMDIERDDMETIFRVLDADASGEVDYVEFRHHLGGCGKRDPLMMSSLTRYSVLELRNLIKQTTNEIKQAIDWNTQMLHQQLDLLCHVPGCEQAAKDLKAKQYAPLGAPSFDSMTSSMGLGSWNIRRPGPDPQHQMNTHDVLSRMNMASKQFQTLQNQMDGLLLKAEELRRDVLQSQDDATDGAASDVPSASSRGRVRLSVASTASAHEKSRADVIHQDLDDRFLDLLQKFQQRFQKEEQMQLKCHEIMSAIASMMEKPVVQNEL